MPNQQAIVIIDQGGQSTRALAFDTRAQLVAQHQVRVNTCTQSNDHIEQDSEEILTSITLCLKQLAEQIRPLNLEPVAAGLIVQRSSLLAVDKFTEKPLSPVISWQDSRNSRWLEEQGFDASAIQQRTGLYPNGHYGASKMRYLLDHDSQIQQAQREQRLLFMPLASYLAKKITDARLFTVDHDIASRTLLLNRNRQQWDAELLQLFDISADLLPCCSEDYTAPEHAARLQWPLTAIPLCLVAGDQSFISYSPAAQKMQQRLWINCGTGAFVQMHTAKDSNQTSSGKLLVSHIGSGSPQAFTLLEGTVNAGASALQQLWKESGVTLCHQQLAIAARLNDNVPVYLIASAGIGSPHWLAASDDVLLVATESPPDITQKAAAIIEAIVFLLMDNIRLLKTIDTAVHNIAIGGGLSALDGLCQKLADISGLSVSRRQQTEASAQGAAYFLLESLQLLDAEAGEDTNIEQSFKPIENQGLNRRYQDFQTQIAQKKAG